MVLGHVNVGLDEGAWVDVEVVMEGDPGDGSVGTRASDANGERFGLEFAVDEGAEVGGGSLSEGGHVSVGAVSEL